MASPSRTRPPKAFIDSTVLFTAAHSPTGGGREVIARGLRGELGLALSDLVFVETDRNLAAKAPAALPAFAVLRQQLAPYMVRPSAALIRRVARVVDPKDAPIVAGAIRARAQYLVTHDQRHLLRQREAIHAAFGIRVVTPGDLLQELGGGTEADDAGA